MVISVAISAINIVNFYSVDDIVGYVDNDTMLIAQTINYTQIPHSIEVLLWERVTYTVETHYIVAWAAVFMVTYTVETDYRDAWAAVFFLCL